MNEPQPRPAEDVATEFINHYWNQDRASFRAHVNAMHGKGWEEEWKVRKDDQANPTVKEAD